MEETEMSDNHYIKNPPSCFAFLSETVFHILTEEPSQYVWSDLFDDQS